MPIPKPDKGESHDDFMDRCMGNDTMVSEYPDNKQRYAICQSSWDDKKGVDLSRIERRFIKTPKFCLETRRKKAEDGTPVEGDGKTRLSGYAALFNSRTEIWDGIFESIAPGAFKRTLAEHADVRALVDHNSSKILGRTKSGTLELAEDDTGLHVMIDPPDTTLGRDTITSIQRGDLDQMSFAFMVREESIKEEKDGTIYRTLLDLDLYDVSVVTYPAYEDTNVEVVKRSIAQWRAKQLVKPPEAPPPPAKPRQPEEEMIDLERRRQDLLQRKYGV